MPDIGLLRFYQLRATHQWVPQSSVALKCLKGRRLNTERREYPPIAHGYFSSLMERPPTIGNVRRNWFIRAKRKKSSNFSRWVSAGPTSTFFDKFPSANRSRSKV